MKDSEQLKLIKAIYEVTLFNYCGVIECPGGAEEIGGCEFHAFNIIKDMLRDYLIKTTFKDSKNPFDKMVYNYHNKDYSSTCQCYKKENSDGN
jgi:hypothetical protein